MRAAPAGALFNHSAKALFMMKQYTGLHYFFAENIGKVISGLSLVALLAACDGGSSAVSSQVIVNDSSSSIEGASSFSAANDYSSSSMAYLNSSSASSVTVEEPVVAEDILPLVAPGFGGNLTSQQAADVTFTIDVTSTEQKIESFGASDAWSIQHVGLWQSAPDIAKLLFSTELDNANNPAGIGLSLWRFNIGAGSASQNNISDTWRRSETFLNANGSYDWSKQQGQQQFMQLAKSHGVEHYVAFSNSPPISLTRNGNAFGEGGGTSNLPANNVDRFSQFLVDVWKYFANPEGPNIAFDYISPVNEPQWNWAQSNGQEGNPYTNSEIANLVKSLDSAITAQGINTQIEIPEAAQLNFFYENRDQRGNQLAEFFDNGSVNRVNNLNSVANKIAGHSYFTTWPVSTLISTRQAIANNLRRYPGTRFWMSEYCVLEDNPEVAGSRDVKRIEPALYTARVIHHDLTLANATSWQWWLAVSAYNYNDGLVYVSKNENEGYQTSKTLWALGQYSRFIRPGMNRVALLRDDQLSYEQQAQSLMASAYHDAESGRVVLVFVNYSEQNQNVAMQLLNSDYAVSEWVPYVTSANDDLTAYEVVDGSSTVNIPARSIVTLVSGNTTLPAEPYTLQYFVNAGNITSAEHPAGLLNSIADQAFNRDADSGLAWGYENTATWEQDEGGDVWRTLRTDEQDQAGQGLKYRFELPQKGSYKVLLGFYDPWDNANRLQDILINGQLIEQNFAIKGQAVLSQVLDNVEGEITVDVLRSAANTGIDDDPLLSWVRILKRD